MQRSSFRKDQLFDHKPRFTAIKPDRQSIFCPRCCQSHSKPKFNNFTSLIDRTVATDGPQFTAEAVSSIISGLVTVNDLQA